MLPWFLLHHVPGWPYRIYVRKHRHTQHSWNLTFTWSPINSNEAFVTATSVGRLKIDTVGVGVTVVTLSTVIDPRTELAALAGDRELLLFGTTKARTSFFWVDSPTLHLSVSTLTVNTLTGWNGLSVVVHNPLQWTLLWSNRETWVTWSGTYWEVVMFIHLWWISETKLVWLT